MGRHRRWACAAQVEDTAAAFPGAAVWRRRGPPGSRMWLSVLLAAAMLMLFLLWINQQIRPILRAMATTQISNAVVAAVSDAIARGIASEHISYEDMVSVETDASGRITALKSNLAQANLLRSELLSMVLEQVSDLTTEDFSIPFGNLTDLDFLSGTRTVHNRPRPVRRRSQCLV